MRTPQSDLEYQTTHTCSGGGGLCGWVQGGVGGEVRDTNSTFAYQCERYAFCKTSACWLRCIGGRVAKGRREGCVK